MRCRQAAAMASSTPTHLSRGGDFYDDDDYYYDDDDFYIAPRRRVYRTYPRYRGPDFSACVGATPGSASTTEPRPTPERAAPSGGAFLFTVGLPAGAEGPI